mmetsp:Transcript_21164/g.43027  ORF Transcript_21164/g.43027 Transcript_21164/m.43027 type:complete len:214 (-) Transcript_21164:998-1639(-)
MTEHHGSQRQCLGMVVTIVFLVGGVILSVVLGWQRSICFDYLESLLFALFGRGTRSQSCLDQLSSIFDFLFLFFAHAFHLHQFVVVEFVLVVIRCRPGNQVEIVRLLSHFLGSAGLATLVTFFCLDTLFVSLLLVRLRHHVPYIVCGNLFVLVLLVLGFAAVGVPSGLFLTDVFPRLRRPHRFCGQYQYRHRHHQPVDRLLLLPLRKTLKLPH